MKPPPPKTKRDAFVKLALRPAERDELRRLADAEGLTPAAWARRALLDALRAARAA